MRIGTGVSGCCKPFTGQCSVVWSHPPWSCVRKGRPCRTELHSHTLGGAAPASASWLLWPGIGFFPAILSWIHNNCALSPSCKSHFVFETCILCFLVTFQLPSPWFIEDLGGSSQSLSFQVRAGFKSQLHLYELRNLGQVVHLSKPLRSYLEKGIIDDF